MLNESETRTSVPPPPSHQPHPNLSLEETATVIDGDCGIVALGVVAVVVVVMTDEELMLNEQ